MCTGNFDPIGNHQNCPIPRSVPAGPPSVLPQLRHQRHTRWMPQSRNILGGPAQASKLGLASTPDPPLTTGKCKRLSDGRRRGVESGVRDGRIVNPGVVGRLPSDWHDRPMTGAALAGAAVFPATSAGGAGRPDGAVGDVQDHGALRTQLALPSSAVVSEKSRLPLRYTVQVREVALPLAGPTPTRSPDCTLVSFSV